MSALLRTFASLTLIGLATAQQPEAAAGAAQDPAGDKVLAVHGRGRFPTSLELTSAGAMQFRLEVGEAVIRMSTGKEPAKGVSRVKLSVIDKVDEGGNVATIYKYGKKGRESLWIWTDIESMSFDNLEHLKLQRPPYCVVQMINAAGIQAIPLDRAGAKPEDRMPPAPPVRFRDGERYGYRNFVTEEVVIKPRFLVARDFGEQGRVDRALVRLPSGWGFVDGSGKLVVPADYDSFGERWFGDQIQAQRNGKWGVVGADGAVLLEPKYLDARPFYGRDVELAPVRTKAGWGFVAKDGREVIAPRFADVRWFGEAGAPASDSSGKWGYIDRTGAWRIEPAFQRAQMHYKGFAVVRLDGKAGVIDTEGKLVIPAKYRSIYGFEKGRWQAQLGDKAGLLAPDGTFTERKNGR